MFTLKQLRPEGIDCTAPDTIANREIRSAVCSGGWGRMDYVIKLKEEN